MLSRYILLSLLGISLSTLMSCGTTPTQRDLASEELEEDDIELQAVSGYPAEQDNVAATEGLIAPNEAQNHYFDWPVDEARLTRGYFTEPKKIRGTRKKRPHWGIDLAAPRGTAVYAAHAGTVIYVGKAFRGFGRLVMIEGKRGWATLYAHLSKAHVKEGQKVKKGARIADMGSTGRSTGPHLHFEIRTLRGPVNPLQYLPNGYKVARLSEQQKSLKMDFLNFNSFDPQTTTW